MKEAEGEEKRMGFSLRAQFLKNKGLYLLFSMRGKKGTIGTWQLQNVRIRQGLSGGCS